ncbi:MAG: hypothetical protein R2856_28185 [Caldilineaceae bacterium]
MWPASIRAWPPSSSEAGRQRRDHRPVGQWELGPILGLADLIVDLVETGSTLRANGLIEFRTIMESQAVLIVNRASSRLRAAEIQHVIERLRAVI